jgi:hypothetical protein
VCPIQLFDDGIFSGTGCRAAPERPLSARCSRLKGPFVVRSRGKLNPFPCGSAPCPCAPEGSVVCISWATRGGTMLAVDYMLRHHPAGVVSLTLAGPALSMERWVADQRVWLLELPKPMQGEDEALAMRLHRGALNPTRHELTRARSTTQGTVSVKRAVVGTRASNTVVIAHSQTASARRRALACRKRARRASA